MNIAIFWPSVGGPTEAKIARKEIELLSLLGNNVELLLIEGNIPAKFKELLGAIKLECLANHVPSLFRLNFRLPGFSFFSLSHLTSPLYSPIAFCKKYDAVVAHTTLACLTAYTLRKYRGQPYVAFIWDPISCILQKVYQDARLRYLLPLLVPLGANLDRSISDAADVVILPSRYYLNHMKNVTRKPIQIVRPGTDPATKVPDARGDYLLAVARWESGKRPFFLLDILSGLKKRGIRARLSMAGRWRSQGLYAKFLKEAKRREVLDLVNICGYVNEAELGKLYFSARVLVNTITESFSMTGLEAAAHGAPVVIPKGTGVTELLEEGVQGFFPVAGDIDGYVESIGKLVLNERMAWRMGLEGWKVTKQYTWEKHAETLNLCLERITHHT